MVARPHVLTGVELVYYVVLADWLGDYTFTRKTEQPEFSPCERVVDWWEVPYKEKIIILFSQ